MLDGKACMTKFVNLIGSEPDIAKVTNYSNLEFIMRNYQIHLKGSVNKTGTIFGSVSKTLINFIKYS